MWGLQIHNTFTGAFRFSPTPSAGSWSRRMSGGSEATHSFKLRAEDWPLPVTQSRDLFEDTKNTIVVTWNGAAVYAGMIQRSDYVRATGVLTVKSVDIRALMKDRLLHGVDNYLAGNLTITARSNPAAVRAIMLRAASWGSPSGLPLELPADAAGSFSVEWKHYQGVTIEDCLVAVEERGVEVDFNPTLTGANALVWQVRVAPKITSSVFDLPVTSPESHVLDLKIVRDAARRLTGVIVFGNGTDEDMVTAWAGVPGYTIPVRDAARPAKDERDVAQLQQIANSYVAAAANPTEEWSFSVSIGTVSPTQLLPGCVLNMDFRGDPWMPDAKYRKRTVALSGDLSMTVTPEVQDA